MKNTNMDGFQPKICDFVIFESLAPMNTSNLGLLFFFLGELMFLFAYTLNVSLKVTIEY